MNGRQFFNKTIFNLLWEVSLEKLKYEQLGWRNLEEQVRKITSFCWANVSRKVLENISGEKKVEIDNEISDSQFYDIFLTVLLFVLK